MKPINIGLSSLGATIAILALPSAAGADYYIPPENSAATQYTEAFPTGGGHREPGAGQDRSRSPDQVLGERNARKLAAQGPQGEAAAEVAAMTAPPTPAADQVTTTEPRSAGSKGGKPATGGSAQPSKPLPELPPPTNASSPPIQPEGSSGLGEVAGQALGTSSAGSTGALLPLAFLGAIAWSFVYLTRKRKNSTA